MKIISHHKCNPKIEVVVIWGELTGRGAIELQNYLYTYLDKGKCYQAINLKNVSKIDGLGINILGNFVYRGLQICLFNVELDIRNMLMISEKEDIFKIYDETDCDKAVSLFEKDILGKKERFKDRIKKRRYVRVNTSLPIEFKCRTGSNVVISGEANVQNLGEGGCLIDRISAINTETGKTVILPEIVGQKLYDLKFKLKLNRSLDPIKTKGECVWEFKTNKNLSVGIHFKGVKHYYKERIKDYICNIRGSKKGASSINV